MCRVRATGPLHEPKLFNFKLCLMRRTDHKNGTPSVARRPRLVSNENVTISQHLRRFVASIVTKMGSQV